MFALGYDNDGEVLVICHNMSEQESNVKLSVAGDMSHLVDLVSDDTYGPSEPDSQDLLINGQGSRCLRGRIDEGRDEPRLSPEFVSLRRGAVK